MKEVQDRIVQYANRYKLTDVDTGTELGIYDFEEVTGTVQQEGTPVDKELFDSIKNDINNIVNGTTLVANTVRYNSQTLTDEQKEQARENIGALGEEDIKINLNGAKVTSPAFYAPTTSGNAGQVLKSMGAGQAPVWANEPADISNAIVTLGASLTYNGSAQEQTIASVTLGGTSLSEGTDYKVTGNIATDAGNYTMAIMGIGNYSGTLFVEWTIAPAQGSISVSETSVNIIGAAGTTKQITVNVTRGYGDLVVTSSASNVAMVSLVGNTLTITSVSEGSATITVRLIGNYSAEESIAANVVFVSSVLNDNTWGVVSLVSGDGLGASFWAVGDTKETPLNGTVGTKAYNNVTLWAYIIGFNHNASVEGEHLIHFGCFKTEQTDGVDIALDDSHYSEFSNNGGKWFNMNHWGNYNYGGWSRCDMRYDILGSTDVAPDGYGASPSSGQEGHAPTSTCATSPVAGTLMATLPEDLRAVMKPVTKYTDNEGGGTETASNVTETTDYLWLLAEYEVFGSWSYANKGERDYQEQYDYYANGNSKVKYRQSSTGEAALWLLRSPHADYGVKAGFCVVHPNGTASANYSAAYSRALAPAFAV